MPVLYTPRKSVVVIPFVGLFALVVYVSGDILRAGLMLCKTYISGFAIGPLNLGWLTKLSEARSRTALAAVGISPELNMPPPFHLNSGEKRRVALAGVLVMES